MPRTHRLYTTTHFSCTSFATIIFAGDIKSNAAAQLPKPSLPSRSSVDSWVTHGWKQLKLSYILSLSYDQQGNFVLHVLLLPRYNKKRKQSRNFIIVGSKSFWIFHCMPDMRVVRQRSCVKSPGEGNNNFIVSVTTLLMLQFIHFYEAQMVTCPGE